MIAISLPRPGSPANGARYIVGPSPTGAWVGQANAVAAFQDGAWAFFTPNEGWLAWIADEDILASWTGTAWAAVSAGGGGSVNPTPLVGVNATADATNKLSVASSAVLFSHIGNGIQAKLNKALAADNASVLFQDGFSGRAEIGLTGDDDFHFKVSANGSTWNEAIVINRTTGLVSLPLTDVGFVAQSVASTDDFSIVLPSATPPFTTCKWSNVFFDSHNGYVPSTGVYTIPVGGTYALFGGIDASGDALANYAALVALPGAATTLATILGFTRTGVKSVVSSATLFSLKKCTAGETIKFGRYYFGGVVTLIGAATSFNGIVRISD